MINEAEGTGGESRGLRRADLREWDGRTGYSPASARPTVRCTSEGALRLMLSRPGCSARASTPNGSSVYRYYDKLGTLLYVGITDRGVWRNREHDSTAQWWPFVDRQEVEHAPSRESAARLEKELVTLYQPPFNRVYNPDHEQLTETYLKWREDLPESNKKVGELIRQLDRNLPFTVMAMSEDRFVLKVSPEYSAITRRLVDLTRRAVLAPKRLGNVVKQSTGGAWAYFLVEKRDVADMPPVGTTGYAPIKYVTPNPPKFQLVHFYLNERIYPPSDAPPESLASVAANLRRKLSPEQLTELAQLLVDNT